MGMKIRLDSTFLLCAVLFTNGLYLFGRGSMPFTDKLHLQPLNMSSSPKNATAPDLREADDGFYSYVSTKGIPIKRLSKNKYRISYNNSRSLWSCDIDTSIAKRFKKRNSSWKDLFETRIEVLRNKTVFSADTLRKKMGLLPKDGTPIILVARQGNVSIPQENVIIRLNNHGPLDAKTTMIMTWPVHVKTLTMSARNQTKDEIIHWTHYKPYGNGRYYRLWNTSHPLVVPEAVWKFNDLKYYRGPLFFMKGGYSFGNLAGCRPIDGIGLGAINRVVHLKGDISTLGFSTGLDDKYNIDFLNRFKLLANKLVWSHFVVKELTDERK
ncbi:uncharacterized protein LOC123535229 [Mercenaria mercenaria]|uniref:uncharacterized protein LOC123535229 n=1 Tax=Mercenaria mercenaria TaxID=6596 RepID=UPI00234E62D6|nr:uncharacterized protein LOC123535229 [Mercenaria mercenaria]XP_053376012.1 uncharacterized protein LOC123535229 [Mercenaria mercenaria]